MKQETLVKKAERWARSQMGNEGSHDYWHAWRVHRLALHLAVDTQCNRKALGIAAWLHDVGDWKASGDLESGPRRVAAWLRRQRASADLIEQVPAIIRQVSFKGAGVATPVDRLEAALLQDADRLDAIGAIGIARTFAYGGSKGRPLHVPGQAARWHGSFRAYQRGGASTLNHFHEKLLLLKGRLHTPQARRLARQRHAELQRFLRVFLAEWGLQR
jgi:uncharacterized protein